MNGTSQLMFQNILVSVSDKTGLVEFLLPYARRGARIVSTGGTAKHLRDHGMAVIDISEQTGFPEVMDGRVKTLHPRVHMALLARPGNQDDHQLLKKEELSLFDLLVVNLYPFEEKLRQKLDDQEQIEFIDIGGPSLLRGAAKNFEAVTVVCDPSDYSRIQSMPVVDKETRRHLAAKVFAHVSSYDAMIAEYLGAGYAGPQWSLGGQFVQKLRYGENPQQEATWYKLRGHEMGLHEAKILQGKELSYNNLLDLDAAATQVLDFSEPAAVAVKHNNPCGVAVDLQPEKALELAIAADPVSVFGGIIAVNFELNANMVERLAPIFLECVVAPSITEEAQRLLVSKKNLRVLIWPRLKSFSKQQNSFKARTVLGGILVQSQDETDEWSKDWVILGETPSASVQKDLLMAWKVSARLKSNAIAIVGNGSTLGLGMGQVNRVDAVAQSIERWKRFHPNVEHAVLASDAFFPFPDSIDLISKSGIRYVIQPGGSMRDDQVKEAAQKFGMTMVLTGRRHFSH